MSARPFCMLIACILISAGAQVCAQQKAVIAFWNIENLFDTIDDPLTSDEEFTPSGRYQWTAERYRKKLERLAEVVTAIKDAESQVPALIGLCEVENAQVLRDLISVKAIRKYKLTYLHEDSPDQRGIDVCLLYDPRQFTVDTFVSYQVYLPTKHPTRSIMVISGTLGKEKTAVMVNHWPSRRGGEKATRRLRMAAAQVVRRISDSIAAVQPDQSLVVMGDFNDDPVASSVGLLTKKPRDTTSVCISYLNPMLPLFRQGIGTLAWNDSWNLFDQVLLSKHFEDDDGWKIQKTSVFNKPFLLNPEGRYTGYPFRTYAAGLYTGGYSDHFPVYVVLSRP